MLVRLLIRLLMNLCQLNRVMKAIGQEEFWPTLRVHFRYEIFNADETELIYKISPDKKLNAETGRGENCQR